jgi:CHAT domain-containing protein
MKMTRACAMALLVGLLGYHGIAVPAALGQAPLVTAIPDAGAEQRCVAIARQAVSSIAVSQALHNWSASPKADSVLPMANGEKAKLAEITKAMEQATSEKRWQDALQLGQQSYQGNLELLGRENPSVQFMHAGLASFLTILGRYPEADSIFEQSYNGLRSTAGDASPLTQSVRMQWATEAFIAKRCDHFLGVIDLPPPPLTALQEPVDMEKSLAAIKEATSDISKGKYKEAQDILRDQMNVLAAAGAKNGGFYELMREMYGISLVMTGDYATARPLFESSLVNLNAYNDEGATATLLPVAGQILIGSGQYEAADALLTPRASQLSQHNTDSSVSCLAILASADKELGKYSEADQWSRRAVEIAQQTPSVLEARRVFAIVVRANILSSDGRYAEGEALLSAAITREQAASDTIGMADLKRTLASLMNVDPAIADTLDAANGALQSAKGSGLLPFFSSANGAAVLDTQVIVASAYLKRKDYSSSAALITKTCQNMRSQAAQTPLFSNMLSVCESVASLAHAGLARKGDERARSASFEEAQRAEISAAGQALAFAQARSAGDSAAAKLAKSYDDGLAEQAELDRQFEAASSTRNTALLRDLDARRQAAALHVSDVAAQIGRVFPGYWDLRQPPPVTIAQLQATTGPDAELLHPDESLVYFEVLPDGRHGIVFAISKARSAVGEIALNGDELKAAVATLRGEIDPCGYGLAPTNCAQNGAPFDRALSYRLYEALLGDPSIQAVIGTDDIKTLLFVPSGALTTFPPAVLVTAPPQGADKDPEALRTTAWLLRSKAIAVLPAVSSLKTLRGDGAIRHAQRNTSGALVAFADPNFSGRALSAEGRVASLNPGRTVRSAAGAPPLRSPAAIPKSVSAYFTMGVPIAQLLRNLPPLPGTATEAEEVRKALTAPPGSLYMRDKATESQLRALQINGELGKAQVIEFATHGLVAGDVGSLAQPALALAAPPPGVDPQIDDGLLTAPEAAALQINADWVILSACNTAAPDAPEAKGLSGLVRGFFFAGARSLLVSHWRLRDDVAARLIPDMLRRYYSNNAITKAEALRQASLAILDERRHPDFALPSAWAPFILVGEPDR